MLILAIVPPCTGECRFVRVIGVLIFANPRTCVAFVLLASGPLGRPSRQHPLPDWADCYRPRYLTIRRHRFMSTVRLRSMTTALTAPPSWPILTRRSTVVSDDETVTVRDCPRTDRRAQCRRYVRLKGQARVTWPPRRSGRSGVQGSLVRFRYPQPANHPRLLLKLGEEASARITAEHDPTARRRVVLSILADQPVALSGLT